MPNTQYLVWQRAEVTSDAGVAPRRLLRLEIGSGLTCAETTTAAAVEAVLQASGSGGADALTIPILASTAMVQRQEGVVVLASTIHTGSEYSGSTSLQAVLSSPTGSIVRARLWSISSASYVSGAALTTDSTGPTIRSSSTLSLSAGQSIYELHLDIAGSGEVADSGVCSFAALRSV